MLQTRMAVLQDGVSSSTALEIFGILTRLRKKTLSFTSDMPRQDG
jgi:hypothetical protein